MMRLRRRRFAEVVERQLTLFAEDNASLLRQVESALRTYDRAPADEAEERYGDFADLADTAREELEELRDGYARTLGEEAAEEYRAAFAAAARRRFPRIGLELE